MTSFFNANPKSSKWFNRDRFVLSNGYALLCRSKALPEYDCLISRFQSRVRVLDRSRDSKSNPLRSCALQYITLHLLGYKLSLDDLKAFRQIDSLTPGHPEAHHTDGKGYQSSCCHAYTHTQVHFRN